MPLADINKWTSGETEAFFDPLQTPPAASVDSNPVEEKLNARASIRKFEHLTIAAVFGAFAAAALVCFVVLTRGSVEPSRAADAKSQSSGSRTLVTGGRVLGDIEGSRPITGSPTEIISTLAMPILNQPTTTPGASSPEVLVSTTTGAAATPIPPTGITHPKRVGVGRHRHEGTGRHWAVVWRPYASIGPNPGGGFYGAPNINIGRINP